MRPAWLTNCQRSLILDMSELRGGKEFENLGICTKIFRMISSVLPLRRRDDDIDVRSTVPKWTSQGAHWRTAGAFGSPPLSRIGMVMEESQSAVIQLEASRMAEPWRDARYVRNQVHLGRYGHTVWHDLRLKSLAPSASFSVPLVTWPYWVSCMDV